MLIFAVAKATDLLAYISVGPTLVRCCCFSLQYFMSFLRSSANKIKRMISLSNCKFHLEHMLMLAQRCEPNLLQRSDMQQYNGLPTLPDQRCNTIWIHMVCKRNYVNIQHNSISTSIFTLHQHAPRRWRSRLERSFRMRKVGRTPAA